MTYVRCVRNETLWIDDPAPTYDPLLVVGRIYKVARPDVNDDPASIRVVDEEGEDYLYPRAYFEPYLLDSAEVSNEKVTIHLGPLLKNILRAEALANQTSVSALLRTWIDERLDLPVQS